MSTPSHAHGIARPARPGVRVAALGLLAALVAAAGCSGGPAARADTQAPPADGHLFTPLPATFTGVAFENRLEDSRELNVFTYRNYYNGGGVAIGDLTADGLPEIVLTSNQQGARLYLNLGGFRFRDVTREARLETPAGSWTTGVTMADVNGDGRLDLYLSRSGVGGAELRANELWIHGGVDDGVPRFEEQAERYGVADRGFGTHAAFLDHDRDGDLDLFLINNSPRPVSSFGLRNVRHVRDEYGGHKLLRNDPAPDGAGQARRFTDVSAAAGIHGSEVGFGLGLAVGDVNRDGWPDVYVANDFFERDYLFVNRGDGSFSEALDRQMPSVTYFSMGPDLADVDNDGWPDVYTTDMLPEDEYRLRTIGSFEGWDVYRAKLRNGYHHQFMRNMLQRNNGDGTFSEVGQLAGVARTDWSWGALIADLDLDGRKDIFVTNGIAKDITSQDYMSFLANEETMKAATQGGRRKVDFASLSRAMSSTPIPNYAFRNAGALRFTNEATAWGLDTPGFSSGAALGDLDGDGAPDLVVNNVNAPAFVYRNDARTRLPEHRWLQLQLEGQGANRFGVGARVTLYAGADTLMQEQAPARGFQSSVDPVLTFGLGARDTVDTLRVEWPDGRTSILPRVAAGQRLVVRQAEAAAGALAPARPALAAPRGALLALVADSTRLDVRHRENEFVDFDRERLIPKLVSTEGPAVAVADVDGDGLDDLYVGGAKDQPGALLRQRADGRFAATNPGLFEPDAVAEDVGALFFDATGDGRPDLYVTSGGSEYSAGAPALQDRLYVNEGGGRFRKAADALPAEAVSGSRPAAGDVDGDGDLDLFVGGRVVPWRYGTDPASTLLRNDGRGRFTDVTAQLAPELAQVGMVTDALWQDVDEDGRADLVVVGEWMPIAIFRNEGGRLARMAVPGLAQSEGWWNRIVAGDFTGDGRVDFVVGNLGLNSRLQASAREPVRMYVKDFDRNGFAEQVVTTYWQGHSYPLSLRDELIRAIPPLKTRFLKYEEYAASTVEQIFPGTELSDALVKSAHTFASALVRNDGAGRFTLVPLPREAQLAPVYGISPGDVDGDGHLDLLLGGNFDGVKPEIGRLAASYGLLLRGDGSGGFTPVPGSRSGFVVPGQTREIVRLRTRDGPLWVVARNDDRPLLFRRARRRPLSGPALPTQTTRGHRCRCDQFGDSGRRHAPAVLAVPVRGSPSSRCWRSGEGAAASGRWPPRAPRRRRPRRCTRPCSTSRTSSSMTSSARRRRAAPTPTRAWPRTRCCGTRTPPSARWPGR